MRRSTSVKCPEVVYAALKSFGSGIIIATAFIHVRSSSSNPSPSLFLSLTSPFPFLLFFSPQLLVPAFESLGSDCLTGAWGDYSWASAIAMASLFAIFLVELIATRTGTRYLRKRGLKAHDPHHSRKNDRGHTAHGTHVAATRPSSPEREVEVVQGGSVATDDTAVEVLQQSTASNGGLLAGKVVDLETAVATGAQHGHGHSHGHDDDVMSESALAQILGVAILEFGVLFHVRPVIFVSSPSLPLLCCPFLFFFPLLSLSFVPSTHLRPSCIPAA
jgi:zinc transporter 1/2/3